MELHELTDKEIKAIGDAVSTIKKFAKYIKEVNLDNFWLRKNLDESIKAGDVTNAQKVALRNYESAEKIYAEILSDIQEECRGGQCPKQRNDEFNCNCPDGCELKQKLVVLSWMRDAFHGNRQQWEWILDLALVGRKLWCNRYNRTNFRVEGT